MARKITTAAAKKAAAEGRKVKTVRRRDEDGEVVEVEIEEVEVQPARVKAYKETVAKLQTQKKRATVLLEKLPSGGNIELKKHLGNAIKILDKRIAMISK